MNITKYEHACLTIEHDGQLLVVDPGNFTTDFVAPDHVAGIVITHDHADHFDHELIAAIMDKNPDAVIVAHPSITEQVEAFASHGVEAGDTWEIGPFHLEFFGGQHAVIFPNNPPLPNLGVMVNDLFYYPGDSFSMPGDHAVDTLALPVVAPWCKINEVIDFLSNVEPRAAFPTHDAILSSIGKELVDRMVGSHALERGIDYQRRDTYTV